MSTPVHSSNVGKERKTISGTDDRGIRRRGGVRIMFSVSTVICSYI